MGGDELHDYLAEELRNRLVLLCIALVHNTLDAEHATDPGYWIGVTLKQMGMGAGMLEDALSELATRHNIHMDLRPWRS